MFHGDHRAYAREKTRAAAKNWRLIALDILVASLIGIFAPPDNAARFWHWIAAVSSAFVGGGALYWLVWMVHLLESVDKVHYRQKRELRTCQRAATQAIEMARETIDYCKQNHKEGASTWKDSDPLVIHAATVLLYKYAENRQDIMLGDLLEKLEIQAGSSGIRPLDILTASRSIGSEVDWADGISLLQIMVAYGALETADGRPFDPTGICLLKNTGRRALIEFRHQAPTRRAYSSSV